MSEGLDLGKVDLSKFSHDLALQSGRIEYPTKLPKLIERRLVAAEKAIDKLYLFCGALLSVAVILLALNLVLSFFLNQHILLHVR